MGLGTACPSSPLGSVYPGRFGWLPRIFVEVKAMLTVITYDVNTEDPAGRRRLRKVARHCVNYGQRVQNSVFECVADAATMAKIKSELTKLIDPEKDSLRFYYLGNNYKTKVEHIGVERGIAVDQPLFL